MGVDPIKWLFDPGNVLVSVDALTYLGGWEKVYGLVEKWHVLGRFGEITEFEEEKNQLIIRKLEDGKRVGYKNLIISKYPIKGWVIMVYTRPKAKITSVILEAEKRRWRFK